MENKHTEIETPLLYLRTTTLTQVNPNLPPEADDVCLKMNSDILVYSEDSETEDGYVKIGSISAISCESEKAGMAFEEISQELADMSFAVFDWKDEDAAEYSPVVRKFLDCDFGWGNTVYISRVILDEPYRGRRFGPMALSRFIDMLEGQTSLVVMKPFPLQFEDVKGRRKEFLKAQRKLRRAWESVGFKRLGRTDYWALDPAKVRPTVDSIYMGIPKPDRIQPNSLTSVDSGLVH